VQEDELSEQQIRTGLIEKRLENATKEADDRVDKIQHKLDEANFELKRKEKSVNANISIRKLNIPQFRAALLAPAGCLSRRPDCLELTARFVA